MNPLRRAARSSTLRKLFLPLLAKLNPGDIRVRHAYTRDRLRMHSFRHRGYWFYGKDRERLSVALFKALIRHGDTVIDVGGHIGFTAILFARLVGDPGKVFVFEPGPNNLPYLRDNTGRLTNIQVIDSALSNGTGTGILFMENLTGQNNTFLEHFDAFTVNREKSYVCETTREQVQVPIMVFDQFAREYRVAPALIKIDVEGFEWEVLQGMSETIDKHHPILMVEVQTHREEIHKWFRLQGYRLFHETLDEVTSPAELNLNTFFFHRHHHEAQLRRLGLTRARDFDGTKSINDGDD